MVDKEDYEKCIVFNWYLNSGGYVTSWKNGQIHRFILNANKGDAPIDHINNDKLDNRKENLRFVTYAQNAQNRDKKKNCTSKYIGVCLRGNKWVSTILRQSDYFDNEEHAAYWYDQLALKYYGVGAKINKIKKPNDFKIPEEKIRTTRKRKTFKQNIIERNSSNIAIIRTSNGKEILVDDDKYNNLQKYSWTITDGYAKSFINGKMVLMHRYLLNAKENDLIDHININSIDNRIDNLRFSDISSNAHNRKKKENTVSKYIGVRKNGKNYQAKISKDGITYSLGTFKTEEEAAKIRDKKAIELYGQYAKLNF